MRTFTKTVKTDAGEVTLTYSSDAADYETFRQEADRIVNQRKDEVDTRTFATRTEIKT